MTKIGKYFPGDFKNDEHYFLIRANKEFDRSNWIPPITWQGEIYISIHKDPQITAVKFIQTNPKGEYDFHYDWIDFPKELDHAKLYLCKAIAYLWEKRI